jgi:hypothetical protein
LCQWRLMFFFLRYLLSLYSAWYNCTYNYSVRTPSHRTECYLGERWLNPHHPPVLPRWRWRCKLRFKVLWQIYGAWQIYLRHSKSWIIKSKRSAALLRYALERTAIFG